MLQTLGRVLMEFMNGATGMAVLGGALIGLAAGLLTLLTGRVMSGSGMIASLLGGPEGIAATSIAFIGGILIAPVIMTGIGFAMAPPVEAEWPFLLAGGLLVGLGAGLGTISLGGAISGIGRRSIRSAGTLLILLASAALAAFLHVQISDGGAT
jgi:uncharacterized protein